MQDLQVFYLQIALDNLSYGTDLDSWSNYWTINTSFKHLDECKELLEFTNDSKLRKHCLVRMVEFTWIAVVEKPCSLDTSRTPSIIVGGHTT